MFWISSKWTLFLKIFLPGAWIFFFGMLLVMSILTRTNNILDDPKFIISFALFYLFFIMIFYFTLFRLKRVECDADSFFVSNYRHTFKYTYESLSSITESDYGLFNLVKVELIKEGMLGKTIYFLPNKKNYDSFVKAYALKLKQLVK